MFVRQVVDEKLAQYAFLIGCQRTGQAIVIDPERDVDRYLELAAREGLGIAAVAETHIHADFLSGARELAARVPKLQVYLSAEGGEEWQYEWPRTDGANVTWLHDDTTFRVGNVEFVARHTPGHTPEHMSFLVTDRGAGADEPIGLLSGDFVFVGDLGRPDLLESAAGIAGAMKPAARTLYRSTRRFLELPDFLQIWPAHGAGSACGKALGAVPTTTVGYERRVSPAIAASERGEEPFVEYILSGQPEPPLYFATMKRLNRSGPPILGTLPAPRQLGAAEVLELSASSDTQFLDLRPDRRQFFRAHLPGALHAPLNKSFPTIVGSLIDPTRPVILLADEAQVDEAVRALMRIGFDRVEGWSAPAVIDELRRADAPLASIESIDFAELDRRRAEKPATVLDVRSASEHAEGHVPGALNIPHTRLRPRLGEVPRGRPVYVHCATGARAAASTAFLASQGLPVVDVDGSFSAWQSTQPRK